jgi:excisionase family DNA binding protein
MGRQPLVPLYVRIPEAHARQLDGLADLLGQSKQQVVSGILESGLNESGGSAMGPRAPASTGGDGEVLTLEQVAALLCVSTDATLEAVRTTGLPGRNIGGEWRFARQAVLAWLALPDPSVKTRPGFKQGGGR